MKNRFHAADVVCLVALLILQTGCATMTRGKTQGVEITSEPSGAGVRILPDGISCSTPCVVDLSNMEETVLALDPRELHVTLEPLAEDTEASEPPQPPAS